MRFIKLLHYLFDDNIKLRKKLLFLLPVIYFFSPINLIPYLLFPVAGWIDNIIVSGIMIFYLRRVLDDYQPGNSGNNGNGNVEGEDRVINVDSKDYDIE